MFTGLVEALGSVATVQECDASRDLTIVEPTIAKDLPIGASVAVNGVCLTVVAVAEDRFRFQAGPETLRLTNLGELRAVLESRAVERIGIGAIQDDMTQSVERP